MDKQKGIIHLIVPILIVLIIGAIFALNYFGIFKVKLPGVSLPQKSPTVGLKTEYKNPFKKESQYVNPFEEYKNPFVTNRWEVGFLRSCWDELKNSFVTNRWLL